MVVLERAQREALERVFAGFDRHDLRYVVLRRYERLPEAIQGRDVDVLVEHSAFEEAIEVCERRGFESPSEIAPNVATLAARAIRKPISTTRLAFTSPGTILDLATGTSPHRQGYASRMLQRGNTKVDLHNHLAYTSPIYEARSGIDTVRVDPTIEQRLLDRRRSYRGFFVPSPVDELAHIVPHCVFDKRGEFPPYYVEKCNELVEEVVTDAERDEEFRRLLDALFYNAADLVHESVVSGEYNCIWPRLIAFDQY